MAPHTHLKRYLKRRIPHFCAEMRKFDGFRVGFLFFNRKPPPPCYLLGLPVELLLYILEILQEATEIPSNPDEDLYPLLSLRLCAQITLLRSSFSLIKSRTCKRIHQLVTPHIYKKVNLNTIPGVSTNDTRGFTRGSLTRTQMLSRHIPRVGLFIREASIRVLKPGLWHRALDVEAAIAGIFSSIPRLESLTIVYDRQDCDPSSHSQLLEATPHLTALRHLTFREAEPPKGVAVFDVPFEKCGSHIAARLLAAIITHHGQAILTIMLYGRIELDLPLFERLRSDTPNLQTLHVRCAISFHHHSLLNERQPWSCSGTLRSLTFLQCNFDAGYVALHLALGTFGALRHCALFSIGHGTAAESTKADVTWNGPPLDSFRLDHFMHWELDALAVVSTRVLVVTTIDHAYLARLMQRPTAFPRVERIRISDQWEEVDLCSLRWAAAARGVEVVPDWKWREDFVADQFDLLGPCSCLGCREARL